MFYPNYKRPVENIDVLKQLLEQEKQARIAAERLLMESYGESDKRETDKIKNSDSNISLLLNHPDPVLQLNFNGDIIFQNKQASIFTSYKYNNQYFDTIIFWRHIAQIIDKKSKEYQFEVSSNGKNILFVCHIIAVENHINIYGKDVTAERKSQLALREHERRWEFALEGVGDGVWEYNFKTKAIFYSAGYKRMLGFKEDEFANDSNEWLSRIHPDDLKIIYNTDELYFLGHINNHSKEYRLRRKDGNYIWVLDRGKVVSYSEDGSPEIIIGTQTNIDKQKQLEFSLKANNNRLLSLITNLHTAVLLEDENRKVFMINKQFCNMLNINVPPETFVGKDSRLLISKAGLFYKEAETFTKRIDKLLEEKKAPVSEEVHTLDGKTLLYHFVPIENDGISQGILWVLSDITEKIEAEKELEIQRKFYEDVLNHIPSDIVVFNPKHEYLFLNPIAIKDPDLRKWLIGKTDVDYCIYKNRPLSIAEKRKVVFDKVIASKSLHLWEEKLTTPDGNIEYHLRHMYPVLDNNGNIKLVIGYGLNITERKRIEERINQSEKRYRDLFNYSQAIICTHDSYGRLLSVNPALCKSLDYSKEELVGKMIYDFIPEKAAEDFKNEYLTEIHEKGVAKGVFSAFHRSGRKIYLLYQNYKLEEPGMEPYIVVFAQDITDRINAERELIVAKQLTEQASKAKETFLANMSHEIRTPMHGVIGIAGLLAKTNITEEQKRYLQMINESANNLLMIVNDVLDLEKIVAGKLDLEQIPFNVVDKVTTAVESFRYKTEEKGLWLEYTNEILKDVIVLGDPFRLSQLLNNFLSNAVKFTPTGAIKVLTKEFSRTDDKIVIEFSVADSGIGINPDQLDKIFEPYAQAHSGISSKYGGTGLGLSICKNLVEMQGGKLHVKSEEHKGSLFQFTIPYTIVREKLAGELEEKEIDYKSLGKPNILVAEDVELNQFLAKHIMASWGFSVDIASNGKEAFEKVKNNTYDIVLMDIQMPEMDGLQATAAIRDLDDERKANIPIIALTANAIRGESEKYLNAGMTDYLFKPFNEKSLFSIIAKYIKSASSMKNYDPSVQKVDTVNENATPAKLYDLKELSKISGDSNDFINKMIHLFINTMPGYIQVLREHTDHENWDEVSKQAHKMKSSIDSMGIKSIKEDIRAIEAWAKEKANISQVKLLIAQVEKVLYECIEQMKQI